MAPRVRTRPQRDAGNALRTRTPFPGKSRQMAPDDKGRQQAIVLRIDRIIFNAKR